MEYYSAIKMTAFESVLMSFMNLEPIIQNEVSQKEKDKYHILMHIYIWNLEKMVLKNLYTGQQCRNKHRDSLMNMERGEEKVRCMERVTWKLT